MKKPFKILITGGNRGIGLAIAEQLLKEQYKVIITARDLPKGQSALNEVVERTGNSDIELIKGDLSTIKGCYELVNLIKAEYQDIDCLISNAGVWMTERKLNGDGLEISFMVNYVAPYILCNELLPILEKNQPSRIVNVNAGLYVKGKLDLSDTPVGNDFHSIKTYANTKLCNVLFSIDFAKRLDGRGVTINSVHPGVINTGLGDSPKLLSKIVKLIKRFWKDPDYGALAPVWLATNGALNGVNGKYYNEMEVLEYIDYVLDLPRQNSLREFTEELIKSKML